jgi:hypothetical protein
MFTLFASDDILRRFVSTSWDLGSSAGRFIS